MISIKTVRGLLFLFVFALPLSLAACGQSASESGYTAAEISRRIIDSQQDLSHLESLAMGDDRFSDFLYNYYDMDIETLDDGVFCYPDSGEDAREVTVLRFKEGTDMSAVEESLLAYIQSRIITYQGYMPAQVLQLEQAVVEIHGQYAALFVCDNPYGAIDAFINCF
jgi:hypothetical protein